MKHLSYADTLTQFPTSGCEWLRNDITRMLREESVKLVVLDDDPTGIQTVHGCLLLTNWKAENLTKAFEDVAPFFYILTNTRSLTAAEATLRTREAMQAVLDGNKKYGFRLLFISRSDSTLRGHFPLEPDTMRQVLEENGDTLALPTFFIPSFFEAGRFTIHGVHYMKDKDELIPVAETEFARDNVFGYQHSSLSEYIVEKTNGRISSENIGHLSLEILRKKPIDAIAGLLESLHDKTFVTVDALGYDDLWTFSAALLHLFKRLDTAVVLRTSSSLPKALSGLNDKPLLCREELTKKEGYGLFVVGSHVQKSTTQLNKLLLSSQVEGFELDIHQILTQPKVLMAETLPRLQKANAAGLVPVLFTSREELRLPDATERLRVGQTISDFLVRMVRELPFTPSFLVGKGGITSHDILTKGLELETATVAGQILPGVPVVQTGPGHRFPNMPYIIFPGNVGDENSLVQVLEKFHPLLSVASLDPTGKTVRH
jgi:uncharacterized protein YgbK (DUF1537 family)